MEEKEVHLIHLNPSLQFIQKLVKPHFYCWLL